jgi:hypothetical protein
MVGELVLLAKEFVEGKSKADSAFVEDRALVSANKLGVELAAARQQQKSTQRRLIAFGKQLHSTEAWAWED